MSVLQRLLRGDNTGRRYSRDAVVARLERSVAALPADGTPVQLVGDYMDAPSYRRWRNRQIKRLPVAFVPPLPATASALVLWAVPPAGVLTFLQEGRSEKLVTAPEVDEFIGGIDPSLALAGVVSVWLENNRGAVLAPPMLRVPDDRPHVVTYGLNWPLPASELLPVRFSPSA